MAVDQQRQEIYEIAEAIAPTWERRRAEVEAVMTPVREWMLRELSPRAGDTVLELAAGVGDTGFDTAMVVGEQGRVICSDFSPAMLDAARRRGAERGLENVDYRVIDAEQIQLETDSVDGVLCRLGYMLMADPRRRWPRRGACCARRPPRPGGLGVDGAEPVLHGHRDRPHPARPPAAARAAWPAGLQHGECGSHHGAAGARGLRRRADRGGGGAVRGAGHGRVSEPDRRHRRAARTRAAGALGNDREAVEADVEDSIARFGASAATRVPRDRALRRRAVSRFMPVRCSG